MEIRSLAFRSDLALLRETGSLVEDRGTHQVVRTPATPTYAEGNFLLLSQAPVPGGEREVVGAFHTEFPTAERVRIGIDGTEEPRDLQAWRDAGLEVVVSTVLTAERLVQPLDAIGEADVRPLESDDDWEARAELSHALHPTASKARSLALARAENERERVLVNAGRGVRLGAFLDGTLVSTAAVLAADSTLARCSAVQTHPDHADRGIDATVLHAVGRHALDVLDAQRLVVVVGADVVELYRGLGFEGSERQVVLQQPAP